MNDFIKELRQTAEQNQPNERLPSDILERLGLSPNITKNAIKIDLIKYINENKIHELHGYVSAIARLVNHKFGWESVIESFESANQPVDAFCKACFGKR